VFCPLPPSLALPQRLREGEEGGWGLIKISFVLFLLVKEAMTKTCTAWISRADEKLKVNYL